MSYIDDFKTRMNYKGGSISGSQLNSTKSFLNKHFKDSLSYQEVFINDSTIVTDVHIVDDSKTKEQKLIISPFEKVMTGHIVHWRDSQWLTIIADEFETHWKGLIKKCESSVKWLNSEGEIKEAPFTLKFASNAYPIDEGKIMILSKEQRQIMIQSNEDTSFIKKDQRFIFDGRCWSVIGYDGLTEGLINLTLQEDLVNEAIDNMELRIANYTKNDNESSPPDIGELW